MNHRDRTAHVKGFTCGYISRGYKPAPESPWPDIVATIVIAFLMIVVIKNLG